MSTGLPKPTSDATRFRNGEDNLHYRHVVGPRKDRGRSCRLCHAPHLAANPALVIFPCGHENRFGFPHDVDSVEGGIADPATSRQVEMLAGA